MFSISTIQSFTYSSHLTKSKCFPDFQACAVGVCFIQDGRFCVKGAIQLNCPTAEANLDRSPLKPVQVNVALWVPLNTNL